MSRFFKFVTERAGSLVSKKLGATILAEATISSSRPDLSGLPLCLFVVVQGAVDAFKYWADKKFGVKYEG